MTDLPNKRIELGPNEYTGSEKETWIFEDNKVGVQSGWNRQKFFDAKKVQDEERLGYEAATKTHWRKKGTIPVNIIMLWNSIYKTNVLHTHNQDLFDKLVNDYEYSKFRTGK
jgi:hypothetical protein